jgi:hypothetical protein
MRLQQVATTWTHRTNTLLVVKSVGLDISRIVVAKIWLEWTTFFSSEKTSFCHLSWIPKTHLSLVIAKQLSPIFQVVEKWFYNKNVVHNKNERIYIMCRCNESILNMVQFIAHTSSKKMKVKFANIFHLLSHGPLTIRHVIFNLKNNLRNHWINNSKWGSAKVHE